EEVNNDEQQEETSIKKENTIKMIVLFIALIIYVALFIGLGFFISTFLFLFFSCVYLAPERNPKLYIQTIIVSIITILILYYSLKVQLNIQLPKGIFIM